MAVDLSVSEIDGDLRLLRACLMCSAAEEDVAIMQERIAALTALRLDVMRTDDEERPT